MKNRTKYHAVMMMTKKNPMLAVKNLTQTKWIKKIISKH